MRRKLNIGLLALLAITGLMTQPAKAIIGTNDWQGGYGAIFLDWSDFGCDESNFGAGGPDVPKSCCDCGMPRWWVNEPYISLQMSDTPLSYVTASGQAMAFQFHYRQRYCLPDAGTVPGCPLVTGTNTESYFRSVPGYGMTNASWGNNWMENIFFWNNSLTNYQALQFGFEGGINYFYNTNGVTSLTTPKSQVQFIPSSGLGYPTTGTPTADANGIYWGGTQTNGFTLLYPDGSKDVYGLCTNASASASYGSSGAYALLTERIDAVGRTIKIGYELATSNSLAAFRVRYVVDADGRTNNFQYAGVQNFWQISEINDPYGRKVQLKYDSTSGYLTGLIDAVQLTNSFSYQGNNGWITNLSTPYGNTGFNFYDGYNYWDPAYTNLIQTRAILISEPEGAHQLFCYMHQNYDAQPATAPTVTGQTNFDEGGSYGGLEWRNSYHWGVRQFAALPSDTQSNLLVNLGYTIFNQLNGFLDMSPLYLARQRHWLLSADTVTLTENVSSERDPSLDPAGQTPGLRTWYNYFGKPSPELAGSSQVSCIARTLPDGSTQFTTYNYHAAGTAGAGMVADTETPYSLPDGSGVGVLTNWFSYSTNDVDLLSVSNSAGQFVNYSYNSYHQVTAITNALNQGTTFTFDAATHQLTGVALPGGASVTRDFYATATPPTSNSGFLKSVTLQPQGRSVTNTSYSAGLPVSVSDDRGLTLSQTWDGLNRPTGIGFPDSTTISNVYYRLDVVATKDRLDHWTHYSFDGLQHLTSVTNANNAVTFYSWCGCGSLESIVDALTNSTFLHYDNQGNLTNIVYPDTSSITRQFDLAGRLTRVTDGAGRWLQFGFNLQGLATGVTNANGTMQSATFDALNRPISVTDANGVTVTNEFDILGRLLRQTWPDGISQGYGYSDTGLIAATNRNGKTTFYGRDAAGRLLAETNANLEVTRYGYNSASQLTDLWDGNTNHVQWQFNQFGWLTNKIDGLSRNAFRYAYNANGWLTNRWTPEKGNTGYGFDNVGNRTSITYPQSSISYAYNAVNWLTNMVDALGSHNFSHTPAGRLQSESGPWSNDTVGYSYVEGLRSAMTIGTNWTQSYGFDLGGRMTNTVSPAGSFNYSYNFQAASALVTGIALPNGAKIVNSFDSLARLSGTALNDHWGHTLDGYAYTPDALGLRTNIVRNLGLTTNNVNTAFDDIGQLTSWSATEANGTPRQQEQLGWQYDSAHNLHTRNNGALAQTFTTDAANQLNTVTRTGNYTMSGATPAPATNVTVNGLTAEIYSDFTFARTNLTLANGSNTFTNIAANIYGLHVTNIASANFPASVSLSYDLNGNLTNDGSKSFAFDAENQLTNVIAPAKFRKDFVYDGLNRLRIKRESSWNGSTWTPTNEIRFIWDGNVIVQLRTSNSVPTLTLTRGLDLSRSLQGAGGIGGLLAMTESSGANYFYHADGNGNITALIDSQETIAARREYGAFGQTLSLTGAKAGLNPFWFSSQLHDEETDFYHYKYRVYSPVLQRWLNQDPIHEAGGINLYCYAGDNPLGDFDIYGLKTFLILIGEEFVDSSSLFFDQAKIEADKIRSSFDFNPNNDTVLIKPTYTVSSMISVFQTNIDIAYVTYIGHGGPGVIYLGRPQGSNYNLSVSGGPINSVSDSSPISVLPTQNVLPNADIGLYSCYSSVSKNGNISIGQGFADHFQATVTCAGAGVGFNKSGPIIKYWRGFTSWYLNLLPTQSGGGLWQQIRPKLPPSTDSTTPSKP